MNFTSPEFYRTLAESTSQLVMVLRADGDIQFVNEQWLSYVGVASKEDIPWNEVILPGDFQYADASFSDIVKSGKDGSIECRIRRHDRHYRYYLFRLIAMRNEKGEPTHWLSQGIDIDDQIFRENSLRILNRVGQLVQTDLASQRMLEEAVHVLVPDFADYCAIDLLEDGKLRNVAIHHVQPEKLPKLKKFREIWSKLVVATDHEIDGLSDKPLLGSADDFISGLNGRYSEELALGNEVGIKQVLRVPIRVNRQVTGYFTVGITETPRRFGNREVEFIQSLADQIGVGFEFQKLVTSERIANERLHQLTVRLQRVQEEERQRISREIHDELGQHLTVLKMELALLGRSVPDQVDGLRAQIAGMAGFVDVCIGSVRKIAADLRPIVLEDLGLAAATEWLTGDFQTRTGIQCRFNIEVQEETLPAEVKTTVFRILQEALTNAARHAKTRRVGIHLFQELDSLHVEIADYGVGISQDSVENKISLGIVGMKERARSVGGEFSVTNQPGLGAVVKARIPLKKFAKTERRNASMDLEL